MKTDWPLVGRAGELGLLSGLVRSPMGGDAVTELLEAVLGGPVDVSAVAALTLRSRGNVLFLRELVMGRWLRGPWSPRTAAKCSSRSPTAS